MMSSRGSRKATVAISLPCLRTTTESINTFAKKHKPMNQTQKKTFRILLIIGAVYFAAFIAPNLTGAREPEMLSVFEIDEYAQYSHAIRMLTPGETLYQTARNFLIYLHYFYGYPFYFFSALALLPLKGRGTQRTEGEAS